MSSSASVNGSASYSLATGDAAAPRLALLNRVYGPDAERLLTQIGVPKGGSVVDFGCGTGSTLPWFSRQVGPTGCVVGLDASAAQLAVAESTCRAQGIGNVQFVEASAYQSGLARERFDVAHCRLLLCHLPSPEMAIAEMAAVTKPDGVVVCFDVDMASIASYPPTDCYKQMRELYMERRRLDGLDNDLGFKLPQLMVAAGLIEPELAIINPVYLRRDQKRLWELSFQESSARTLERGLIDRDGLERLNAELLAVAHDETIAVVQARMPVCWARKPS
jgi:SAM-dependent methyltransferase